MLEKGSEVGAHILSGIVVDPSGLDALIPDWREQGCPLQTQVNDDRFYFLGRARKHPAAELRLSAADVQSRQLHRQLKQRLQVAGNAGRSPGVEIYPGFPAAQILYGDNMEVTGVITGDQGIGKDGEPKDSFQPGMMLLGKYTLFAEGARGHLTKRLVHHYRLEEGRDPQKYGIGLKELWELPKGTHKPGLVVHSMGWPLDNGTGGGLFLYHWGENFCSVGFVVHLNYANPYLSPFDEFQRAQDPSAHPRVPRRRQAHRLWRAGDHRGRLAVDSEADISRWGADRLRRRFRQPAAHQGQPQCRDVRHPGGGLGVQGAGRRPAARRTDRLRAERARKAASPGT